MIDIANVQYRLVIMDEKGKQYNIKDYVDDLGWEQGEKELSTRISFTTRNEKSTQGLLSSIAKLGCLVGIFATDSIILGSSVSGSAAKTLTLSDSIITSVRIKLIIFL